VSKSRPGVFASVGRWRAGEKTIADRFFWPKVQQTASPPRLDPPPSLPFCSTALYDRAARTYGKSFPDYLRGLVGDDSNTPDVVAYPPTEEEVAGVLDGAGGAQASVTPFGGGSSVVGGVEPHRDAARGEVSCRRLCCK
jgi:alkyldihydroxyacetonephosphate synthase